MASRDPECSGCDHVGFMSFELHDRARVHCVGFSPQSAVMQHVTAANFAGSRHDRIQRNPTPHANLTNSQTVLGVARDLSLQFRFLP